MVLSCGGVSQLCLVVVSCGHLMVVLLLLLLLLLLLSWGCLGVVLGLPSGCLVLWLSCLVLYLSNGCLGSCRDFLSCGCLVI